jgi:hypothetical protein
MGRGLLHGASQGCGTNFNPDEAMFNLSLRVWEQSVESVTSRARACAYVWGALSPLFRSWIVLSVCLHTTRGQG